MRFYGNIKDGFDMRHLRPEEALRYALAYVQAEVPDLTNLHIIMHPQDYANLELGFSYRHEYEGDALILHIPRRVYVIVDHKMPEGEALLHVYRDPERHVREEPLKVKVLLAQ